LKYQFLLSEKARVSTSQFPPFAKSGWRLAAILQFDSLATMTEDRSFADAKFSGDRGRRQPAFLQLSRPFGPCFCRTFLSTLVDAFLPGNSDAGFLPFLPERLLDLDQSLKQGSNLTALRAIDLKALAHYNQLQTPVRPIRENVDSVAKPSA
jgi:hypothetical protein